MRVHKLEKYFEDTECHENTGLSKGENIRLMIKRNSIDKAIYVGDTQGDCDATRFAGIPFVFAEYGFGNAENPDYTIHTFKEISEVASNILDN